jgi:hypothetical protein
MIAIITAWSESLGMGHIQRMSSLVWYLNESRNIKAFLIIKRLPDSFPPELSKYVKADIDFSPDLIIRDMRDSSEEEIIGLKKISKIMVIDDYGPGRGSADRIIDILPDPESEKKDKQFNNLIYGYNFLKSLSLLKDKTILKNIDTAIYPGNSPTEEYIDFLSSLIPKHSSFAVLNYNNSCLNRNGSRVSINDLSHAEIILSSKAVLSHFGILLYEGLISGCRLISLNPSEYHSKLTDLMKEEADLINLGEYKKINKNSAAKIIKATIRSPLCKEINAREVYNKAIEGLDAFFLLGINPYL